MSGLFLCQCGPQAAGGFLLSYTNEEYGLVAAVPAPGKHQLPLLQPQPAAEVFEQFSVSLVFNRGSRDPHFEPPPLFPYNT